MNWNLHLSCLEVYWKARARKNEGLDKRREIGCVAITRRLKRPTKNYWMNVRNCFTKVTSRYTKKANWTRTICVSKLWFGQQRKCFFFFLSIFNTGTSSFGFGILAVIPVTVVVLCLFACCVYVAPRSAPWRYFDARKLASLSARLGYALASRPKVTKC